MSVKLSSFLLYAFCLSSSLLSEGCQSSTTSAVNAKPPLDACRLLSSPEIESIQGAAVQQTQPSIQKQGSLDISQCYYTIHSPDGAKNLSVYVQVVQRDPNSAPPAALKEFWEERFGPANPYESKERLAVVSVKKRIEPPLPVAGIGDQAFWLASARGGALYVLANDKVVRVSAGGENDAKTRLENSIALAKKILERLT